MKHVLLVSFTWLVILVAALLSVACSGNANLSAPTVVTPPAAVRLVMAYDINIPDPHVAATLQFSYPHGIELSPIAAQRAYDYTATYGGSPNVYYGETAPSCEYPHTGIVVAPRSVAAMDTFTAGDWPQIGLGPGTYVWTGRFVYTLVPHPGDYTIDPTQHCNVPVTR